MEIRVHIGAHKTATTNFQDNLESLFKSQISNSHYFTREYLRRKKFARYEVQGEYDGKSIFSLFNFLKNKNSVKKYIKNSDYQKYILSEELILGRRDHIFDGFYSESPRRVYNICKLFKNCDLKLFISVRNYSELLPSAYCEMLKFGKPIKPFDYYLANFIDNGSGWLPLIKNIQHENPHVPLTVWRFEDYVKNPRHIIEEFTGVRMGDHPIIRERSRARFNTNQVSALLRIQKETGVKTPISTVEQILAKHKKGDKYAPISARDSALLSKRYDDEISEISKMDSLTLIKPK